MNYLCALCHWVFSPPLWSRQTHYPHLTDEDREAQRGKIPDPRCLDLWQFCWDGVRLLVQLRAWYDVTAVTRVSISTCFGEVFVPGTSAKAIFAFDPHRKFLFPGWGMSLSHPMQSWEERLVLSRWTGLSSGALISFILSSVPERVQAAPSHQSCRTATLSRADTTETVIGIIFARSKMVISSGTRKA